MRVLLFLINLHIVLMVCSWTVSASTKSPASPKLSTSTKSPAITKSPTSTRSPPPFSVDCKNKTLTLRDYSTETIVGTDGCSVHNSSNTFTLGEPCLSTGIIVLEKTNPNNGIVTVVARYNVTCEDDVGVVMVVNSTGVAVNESTASPTPFTVSPNEHADATKVHLMLLRKDPDGKVTAALTSTKVKSAQLGEKLFLTLFSDETGVVNVIPLSCMAEVDNTHSINATLWQLHNSTFAEDCYSEKQVMRSKFSRKNGTNVYVAEIEAFRFRDNQNDDIVFSCKVRVCSTETGLCGQEKKDVEKCSSGSATGAAPGKGVAGRRRRGTEDSDLTRGRVDHVTARLRVIVDNGVTYGGATRATLTVTSLILTAVAMVML